MTDMRRLIAITESYINQEPLESAYVPGSSSDPSVDWINKDGVLVRKPGRSLRWEPAPLGQDWIIRSISNNDEMLTNKEWQAATGKMLPRFGMVYNNDGILRFVEKDDAERAIKDYEVGMHAKGYTNG
jgi:hypothetical protein